VQLHTECRVKAVNQGTLVVFDKHKNSDTLPYGVCIWSTGIEPVPLVKDLSESMSEVQTNKKALIVDDNLFVKGTSNIFAIGDCATLERRKLKDHLNTLFEAADTDKNGELSWDEFHIFMQGVSKKYPQLEVYTHHMMEQFHELDVDQSGSLSMEEFRTLLHRADSEVTVLPTTAQVATQEGKYVANLLNKLAKNENIENLPAFQYHHHGSFANLGGGEAVGEVPGMIKGGGFQVWLMWRGIYLSRQFTFSNMWLLTVDWFRTILFGRDISRF